jgi:hypothetical protein
VSKRKAFITGITGQDGSYLAEILLEKDVRLITALERADLPTCRRRCPAICPSCRRPALAHRLATHPTAQLPQLPRRAPSRAPRSARCALPERRKGRSLGASHKTETERVSLLANGGRKPPVGARLDRARRAVTIGRVAHQAGLRRILSEIGLAEPRDATREGARTFARARGARHDVHQARATALIAPGPSAGRLHRGARWARRRYPRGSVRGLRVGGAAESNGLSKTN